MNTQLYDRYKALRAEHPAVSAHIVMSWLRAKKPDRDFDLCRNGKVNFVRDGWTIDIRTTVDSDADLSYLGEFSDRYQPGALRNPESVSNRHRFKWFIPQITAEAHTAGLLKMGYARGLAHELGNEYVHRDMKRLLDAGNYWEPIGIEVVVSRESIELGFASLWGLESDAGDYLNEAATELIEEALEDAKARRERLCCSHDRE